MADRKLDGPPDGAFQRQASGLCQPLTPSCLFYKSRRERSLDELISIVSPELQIKSYIARGNGVNRSHFSPSGERYEVLGIKVTLRTVTIIRRNG